MKANIVIALGVIGLIIASACALSGHASTNTLPDAVGGVVSVNSNGVITAPAGIIESNGLARVNPGVCLANLGFSDGWSQSDSNVWTNAAGWIASGILTNGTIDIGTNTVVSPWFSGTGLCDIHLTWASLLGAIELVEWSTNNADWSALSGLTGLRAPWAAYKLRISATPESAPTPDPQSAVAILSNITVFGHSQPVLIGHTNDFAGIVIRVDDPVGSRDAVNLQTLDNRLAMISVVSGNSSAWSTYPAIQALDLAGHPLTFDSRYQVTVSNDTLTLAFAGQSVFEITGGGAVIPRINFFQWSSTQITMRVSGSLGVRPYPEWSGDLMQSNSWTRLDTNDFTSTYPVLDKGQYTLLFAPVTNSPAYYRVVGVTESAQQLGMTIDVPLTVNGPVIGPGMGSYATTGQVSAITTNLQGYATTGQVGALTAALGGYATTGQVAAINTNLSGYATTGQVGTITAALDGYATTGQVAAISTNLQGYATTGQVGAITAALGGYATTGQTAAISNRFSGYATTGQVAGISNIFNWIVSIELVSNIVVTATNGAGYDGPALGTLYTNAYLIPGYSEEWKSTNYNTDYTDIQLRPDNTYLSQNLAVHLAAHVSPTLIGTYVGTNMGVGQASGTGTFQTAYTTFWKTNWTPYLDGGTATLARLTGPVTNQFAPPIPSIVWSGNWTNILNGQTNILQFGSGYATNKFVP